MNIKSAKQVENVYKELFNIYMDEEVVNEKPVFGSREQVEVYGRIMYGEYALILNAPIFGRLDFTGKIDLDKLEFNTSINKEGAFMCRYNEAILFDFDIVGESVLVKFESDVALSLPLESLKEFPDFIVLLNAI